MEGVFDTHNEFEEENLALLQLLGMVDENHEPVVPKKKARTAKKKQRSLPPLSLRFHRASPLEARVGEDGVFRLALRAGERSTAGFSSLRGYAARSLEWEVQREGESEGDKRGARAEAGVEDSRGARLTVDLLSGRATDEANRVEHLWHGETRRLRLKLDLEKKKLLVARGEEDDWKPAFRLRGDVGYAPVVGTNCKDTTLVVRFEEI